MGAEEIIIVDIFREKIEKDDILLLATDGLTGLCRRRRYNKNH